MPSPIMPFMFTSSTFGMSRIKAAPPPPPPNVVLLWPVPSWLTRSLNTRPRPKASRWGDRVIGDRLDDHVGRKVVRKAAACRIDSDAGIGSVERAEFARNYWFA